MNRLSLTGVSAEWVSLTSLRFWTNSLRCSFIKFIMCCMRSIHCRLYGAVRGTDGTLAPVSTTVTPPTPLGLETLILIKSWSKTDRVSLSLKKHAWGTPRRASAWGYHLVALEGMRCASRMQGYIFPLFLLFLSLVFTFFLFLSFLDLSLIHIWRCRRRG